VRIAKHIPEGKIFAADIEPDMVRYLGERARREHLINLVAVQASADAANLPELVDVALVVDIYHHSGNRIQFFAKLKSSLRPGGRLVIVHYKADSPNGPPVQHRISPGSVTQGLKAAGYALVGTLRFLPRQYFLVFDRATSRARFCIVGLDTAEKQFGRGVRDSTSSHLHRSVNFGSVAQSPLICIVDTRPRI
jgi:SAM-dependent methyltransferase